MKNKERGKYFEDVVAEKIRLNFKLTKKDVHRNFESGMASIEYGDIAVPFDCVVECKYHKSWTENTLMKYNKQLLDWWTQLEDAHSKWLRDSGRTALKALVFSKPHANIYVMLDKEMSIHLDENINYINWGNKHIIVLFEYFLDILKEKFPNGRN